MIAVANVTRDEYDVYVGRPTKWGNPFVIGRDGNRKEVIEKYRDYIKNNMALMTALPELKDKRLGCWCAPSACHADILIELANKEVDFKD